ncbi:TKL/TKL-ccin protein kinase [Mycena sanguinolenta]|uniref:TKL/TKL-ccin protein kinase n=1 Tax=Mycena sanguinolenta TaxID=230812 RepID=A0A8H6Z3J0_9AGAR|nr:TKL/TKL-ccin protein kinase [Mycena sanguinolenta]
MAHHPPSTSLNGTESEAGVADLSLSQQLDLTGNVRKIRAFPFEFGGTSDISLGSVKDSMNVKDEMVAIKIFRIHIDGNVLDLATKELYAEAQVWLKLEHPNVLPFLGIALHLGPSPALITPYCHSSTIMRYLANTPKNTSRTSRLEGLSYLHTEGLVHGNLTTKKILIDDNDSPVISGYGLSNVSRKLLKNSTITPSARFTAPEYFIDETTQESLTQKTTAGDVYSFAMVVLEVMSGVQPFYHLNSEISVVLNILPGGRPSRSELDPLMVSDHMDRVIQALKSLQTGEESPADPDNMAEFDLLDFGPSVVDAEDEEEVCFGHPCIAEIISSQSLKGRVFRTDQFPFTTGGNSNIYRGQLIHKTGKVQVAIKFIRVSNDGSGQLQELLRRLKRETRVWSTLNHRNLLPFLGVWDEPVAPYPALIAPLYKSGDLGQYLRKCSTVDKEKMILGVAAGLEYLHRHEIVHGDLKVHNVLVDKHGAPCICDFGISKIINFRGFTTASVGTAPYMAPELFVVLPEMNNETLDRSSTSTSSDMYSFALLVLEIVTTNPPKHRPTQPILTAKAHNNLRPRRSDYDSDVVSSELWNLLDACWEPDPSLRPTIGDVILRMPINTSEIRIATQNFLKIGMLLSNLQIDVTDFFWSSWNSTPTPKKMKSIIEGVTRCLMNIHTSTNIWAKQIGSRIQSILKQEQIGTAIADCPSALSTCSTTFELIPHLGVYEDAHYRNNNRKDHDEVLDYLAAIQNAQIIGQEISTAARSDLQQIMAMIQQLMSTNLRDNLHSGLSANLYDLQFKNQELLPDFHLRAGEVIRLSQFPVSGSHLFDVYEGQQIPNKMGSSFNDHSLVGLYLGREKVAIKVVRAVAADERALHRFHRECDIWKNLWNIDKGRHIVPFYGYCSNDGPFPYMVSPWQANGNVLDYVKTHDNLNIDYKQLVKDIASGVQVLHSFSPPVIHGDLRAFNIVIDAAGRPLISDFGLSRIVEDITGMPYTQTRGVDDSYRWYSPEVMIGQGIMSLSSDVYSYGMTVLELFTHKQPYNEIKHTTEVVIRAAKGELPARPTDPKVLRRGLDDDLWNLLTLCWATEPTMRLTVQQVLELFPY